MIHRTASHPGRHEIYYWKCDRPAAFHGTQLQRQSQSVESHVRALLASAFPGEEFKLEDGGGQGNHLTWIVRVGETSYFLRVEDGPEQDNHLEVETHVIRCVREQGVPAPHVHLVDVRRTQVPFAWQLMELISSRDLNWEVKHQGLQAESVASEIGAAIARWQRVDVSRFGHFDPVILKQERRLQGFYSQYSDYYFLNWERHLRFLEERRFLSAAEAAAIRLAVDQKAEALDLTSGCLVHKDLAFWNILGDRSGISAYIDWDDAVAADEMDDLSLLGCFHDGPVIARAIQGYTSEKPLPAASATRFWLHLLRNMIVKSVIRVGAGYFERTDGFFLIGSGMTGADLVKQTRSRIFRVLDGLESEGAPEEL